MLVKQAKNIREQILRDHQSLIHKGRIELSALIGQVSSYWSIAKSIDPRMIDKSKETTATQNHNK